MRDGRNVRSMSTAGASLTADGIIGALAEHRERIRSLGVRRIGVFGSFARGETMLWNAMGRRPGA